MSFTSKQKWCFFQGENHRKRTAQSFNSDNRTFATSKCDIRSPKCRFSKYLLISTVRKSKHYLKILTLTDIFKVCKLESNCTSTDGISHLQSAMGSLRVGLQSCWIRKKKHGIFWRNLHPPKQTWNLKMVAPWKRRFLLETIIFRGYVSFRECNDIIEESSTQRMFISST